MDTSAPFFDWTGFGQLLNCSGYLSVLWEKFPDVIVFAIQAWLEEVKSIWMEFLFLAKNRHQDWHVTVWMIGANGFWSAAPFLLWFLMVCRQLVLWNNAMLSYNLRKQDFWIWNCCRVCGSVGHADFFPSTSSMRIIRITDAETSATEWPTLVLMILIPIHLIRK